MSRDFYLNGIGITSRAPIGRSVHNNIQQQASSPSNVDKKNSFDRLQPFATGPETSRKQTRKNEQEKRLCDSANFIKKTSLYGKHDQRQLYASNERLDTNYGLDKSSCHENQRYERTHYESESIAPEKLFEICDRPKRHSAKTTCDDYGRQTSEANSNIGNSALRDGQKTMFKFKLRLQTDDSDQLDQREKTHERQYDEELARYTNNVVDLLEQREKEIAELRLENQKNADKIVQLQAIAKEKDNEIETKRMAHMKNKETLDKLLEIVERKGNKIENMRQDCQQNADNVRAIVEETDKVIEKMRLEQGKNAALVDKLRATVNKKDNEIENMRLDHQKNADMVDKLQATVKEKDNDMEIMCQNHQKYADMVDTLRATVQEKNIQIEKMHLDHQNKSDISYRFSSIVKEKEDEIVKMRRINDRVMREQQESERRSKEITREMAKIMQTKGKFENSVDKMANTQLADRFQGLYDKEWVQLCKWLSRTFHTSSEIKIIETLSKVMRMSYLECLKLAQTQLKEFLLLQETEEEPLQNEHEDLFNLRKQYAHTEQMRLYVRKVVSAKTNTTKTIGVFLIGDFGHYAEKKIQTFLNEFIDYCWLMIVSKPTMSLNYDVIGKQYGEISDYFTIYSTKKPIEDETLVEGTVYEVVWPSVCLKDGSAYYKKGDVILVKKGRQYSAHQRKCEAATNT